MERGFEVLRLMETESSHLDKITPAEIIARRGNMTGANICWPSGTCNPTVCVWRWKESQVLLNVWKYVKYVWEAKRVWWVPWGSASTKAKVGTCSVSQSFLTINLLFTSGTPLPWSTNNTSSMFTEHLDSALSEKTKTQTVKIMSYLQKSPKYCENKWN